MGTQNLQSTEYATTDFYLAAYLKARGVNLMNVEREGRRSTFVFGDRPDRLDLMRAYYNEGTVGVKDFRHAIEDLKAAIHNW